MAHLGVHFVLTSDQRENLLARADDSARLDYVQEHIEEAWDRDNAYETDKAWYAIHCCLTGTQRSRWPEVDTLAGAYPLNQCFLGARSLYEGRDYVINLIEPATLRDLNASLAQVDREWLMEAYMKHEPRPWPVSNDAEDFEYTWEYFQGLKSFLLQKQETGRSLIFTVDL